MLTFQNCLHQFILPHLIAEFDQISQCFFFRFVLRLCLLKDCLLLFDLRIHCICIYLASSACHSGDPPIS